MPDKDVEVYSFCPELDSIEKLLTLCGFRMDITQVAHGRDLPKGQEISPAITDSAARSGKEVDELAVLNLVVGKKVRLAPDAEC